MLVITTILIFSLVFNFYYIWVIDPNNKEIMNSYVAERDGYVAQINNLIDKWLEEATNAEKLRVELKEKNEEAESLKRQIYNLSITVSDQRDELFILKNKSKL